MGTENAALKVTLASQNGVGPYGGALEEMHEQNPHVTENAALKVTLASQNGVGPYGGLLKRCMNRIHMSPRMLLSRLPLPAKMVLALMVVLFNKCTRKIRMSLRTKPMLSPMGTCTRHRMGMCGIWSFSRTWKQCKRAWFSWHRRTISPFT